MKLYLSGGIANVPDFLELFGKNAYWLRQVGYEVVNPTEVQACTPKSTAHNGDPAPCLEKGEPGTPGDPHSWNCYLRHDIAEMMTCDGIAMMDESEKSRGARLELFLAGQVGIEIDTVQGWVIKAPV